MAYKHFAVEELTCKCGCGSCNMDESFMLKLDFAREIAEIPFVVTSGYRCAAHNKAVGSKTENHTSGRAADIYCIDDMYRERIVKALINADFSRIGLGSNFIHVDSMPRRGAIWLY